MNRLPKIPQVADDTLMDSTCKTCDGTCPLYNGEDANCHIIHVTSLMWYRTMNKYEEMLDVTNTKATDGG
jgi:hypothetical protein